MSRVDQQYLELERLLSRLGDDPALKRAFAPAQQYPPWLWQNGPERRFLVYALSLRRL